MHIPSLVFLQYMKQPGVLVSNLSQLGLGESGHSQRHLYEANDEDGVSSCTFRFGSSRTGLDNKKHPR